MAGVHLSTHAAPKRTRTARGGRQRVSESVSRRVGESASQYSVISGQWAVGNEQSSIINERCPPFGVRGHVPAFTATPLFLRLQTRRERQNLSNRAAKAASCRRSPRN